MRIKLGTVAWASASVVLTYIFINLIITTNGGLTLPNTLKHARESRKDSHALNTKFLNPKSDHKELADSALVNSKFLEDENKRLKKSALDEASDANNHKPKRQSIIQQNTNNGNWSASRTGNSISGSEVRHVVLLKVHKTASSTAQNVFLRFGDSRNLTFVLAHTNGESGWLNVISYVNSITKNNVVPPPPGFTYDIMCCHVIYNRESFRAVLPEDTVYIGIVREPFSRFLSAVKYFSPHNILGIPGNHPVSTFVRNPLKYEKSNPRSSQTNNRMAVEFGFPLELFPGGHKNSCRSCISDYLKQIDMDFKFIIISEKFAESIVYMKRLLRWQTKDILYLDQNISPSKYSARKQMQDGDKDHLKNFLSLDIALYDFALKRFKDQTEKEGKDFITEVEHFKDIRQKVNTFCDNETRGHIEINETKYNKKFSITTYDCKQFTKHEKDLIQKQRWRLYGTLDN